MTGTTAFVLVVLLGRRILTAALPVWAAIACVVALGVTTVASVVLLNRRLAGVPPDGQPVGLPMGWVLAGSGGAAVLGGILLLLADDGVWAVAPATMVAVLATFLPRGAGGCCWPPLGPPGPWLAASPPWRRGRGMRMAGSGRCCCRR
jgi:two-component system, NarL family, sensor histidine kinase DesK